MEGNNITVGFINVVATPHPEGAYLSGFERIANVPVRYRGKDYAVILGPRIADGDDELIIGRISVWTDIDSSEPSIDKSTFKAKNVEDSLKAVFKNRGFNNRTFNFAFDLKTHILAIELKNEDGKTLSILQALKIFQIRFEEISDDEQYFEVTIKPEEDALDRVLSYSRLDRVKIVLKRPNPGDHHGDEADEILRELEEQNMKEAKFEFRRQPKTQGVHLNAKNTAIAKVASENGYVESSGEDEYGNTDKRSTKKYPKIVTETLAAGTLFTSFLKGQVKRFRG